MKKIALCLALVSLLTLTACAEQQGADLYNAHEVGKASDVVFGKILSVRNIKIQEENTGTGAMAGATAGGVAGSNVGKGDGSVATLIAGAVIGGIVGSAAEKSMRDHMGVQYVIKKENGKTVSIVQNIGKDEKPLVVGQRVMIQTSGEYQKADGGRGKRAEQYQRVLPVEG